MTIEVRMRVPGSNSWMVSSFDEVFAKRFDVATKAPMNFLVATQTEADMLEGYGLMYSCKLNIHTGDTQLSAALLPLMWVQIVEVSPLT